MAKKGKKSQTEAVETPKVEKRVKKEENSPLFTWPFGKINLILFLTGFLAIVMGYIIMGTGEVDSFASVTLAPFVLIIGYVIIIPLAILWPDKKSGAEADI